MSYSASSVASLSLNERLQEVFDFVRNTKQFRSQDAMNAAEDIAELIYADLENMSFDSDDDVDTMTHVFYNEIYDRFLNSDDYHMKERVHIVLQRLYVTLFGPKASPILPLELIVKNDVENGQSRVAIQANSLIRILTGQPGRLEQFSNDQILIRAIWWYPRSTDNILLGGNLLLPENEKALEQGGFIIKSKQSPFNYQTYYQLELTCKRVELPISRQFVASPFYEKETTRRLMETMF